MADAAAKHAAIRKAPPGGWRRFDKQTEGGAARFLCCYMSEKKKRSPRRLCPEGEPPAFSQAEMFGVAPDFENGGRKSAADQRCFGQPEGILQLAGGCIENVLRIQPELFETRWIGGAAFLRGDDIAHPENGCIGILLLFQLGCESKGKAGCRARIRRQRGADFGHAVQREATFQGVIHCVHAKEKARLIQSGSVVFRILCKVCLFCSRKCGQGPAFQFGDLFTQGKNRLLRPGVPGHGVSSIHHVLFMFL
ncbi:hypothetical protein KX729_23880 [Rhizobium sp. XQZ8]|nr:hypothetical protein [Rhizobium populisoli]